jgi:hypothetical protein
MVALNDIKVDLPEWPDEVIEGWLLKFANQPDMGWPPPDPLGRHRWGLLIMKPIRWWKDVSWKLEDTDCGFDKLSTNTQDIMLKMFDALVNGKKNGFEGDNSAERFRQALRHLGLTGSFYSPPVTTLIDSGLSCLDGNHRMFAHFVMQMTPDEELAKNKIARPAALQKVWVGCHKDGEVLEN